MSDPKKLISQLSGQKKIFSGIDLSVLSLIGLGTVSLGLIISLSVFIYGRNKVYNLTIAAGSSQGESYIISKAIETTIERHYGNIHITVQETGGTSENLKLLEEKKADLVTAQSDVPVNSSARIISILYDDRFQLLVRTGSGIKQFSDLRGKRIALPQKGGQYQSFLTVAHHFGLKDTDFNFVGNTEQEANEAFINNQADAVFKVRILGNPAISKLTQIGGIEFIPIDQAEAIKIKQPALKPSIIPKGAYQGNPAIPPIDLSTIAVERTLLAHKDLDHEIVKIITTVLTERRQEIADIIGNDSVEIKSLVASIKKPETETGLGAPLHPGAEEYYNREKPSFVQEHADFVGLILTIALLFGSWGLEVKTWLEKHQKNQADEFTNDVIEIMNNIRQTKTLAELEKHRNQLLDKLELAVVALDKDYISENSFQSFRVIWQIVIDVSKEQRITLISIQNNLAKQQKAQP